MLRNTIIIHSKCRIRKTDDDLLESSLFAKTLQNGVRRLSEKNDILLGIFGDEKITKG